MGIFLDSVICCAHVQPFLGDVFIQPWNDGTFEKTAGLTNDEYCAALSW